MRGPYGATAAGAAARGVPLTSTTTSRLDSERRARARVEQVAREILEAEHPDHAGAARLELCARCSGVAAPPGPDPTRPPRRRRRRRSSQATRTG